MDSNKLSHLPAPEISLLPEVKRSTPKITTTFKSKKRKKEIVPDSPETIQLRKKVKQSYITESETLDPSMMNKIDKMSTKKLEEYILLQDFKKGKSQQENFSKSLLYIYSMALDKIGKGNGKIQEKLSSDTELLKSFEAEIGNLWVLFSNKVKIGILSISDVLAAKLESKTEQEETVVEDESEQLARPE
jgi:hypothetical protein